MRKVLRVVIIILIIFSVVGFGVFVLNYYNSKELKTLTEEVNKLLEIDLSKDTIDTQIKCSGKFADVENTIKTYLNDSQKIYKDLQSIYEELNADKLFTSNELDTSKLKDIQSNLDLYVERANNLSKEYKEQNSTTKKEEYQNRINGLGASYYRDIFKSLINSEVVNNELLLINDKVDMQYQNITTRVYNTNKVIDFLISNQSSWEMKNGRIQFNNVNKLAEYYQILNKNIQE